MQTVRRRQGSRLRPTPSKLGARRCQTVSRRKPWSCCSREPVRRGTRAIRRRRAIERELADRRLRRGQLQERSAHGLCSDEPMVDSSTLTIGRLVDGMVAAGLVRPVEVAADPARQHLHIALDVRIGRGDGSCAISSYRQARCQTTACAMADLCSRSADRSAEHADDGPGAGMAGIRGISGVRLDDDDADDVARDGRP